MHFVVTGAAGMLAQALVPMLRSRGHQVTPLTRADLDVTDADQVERVLDGLCPHVVVQCAAFTAVDAAEEQESAARAVNAEGTRNVARSCRKTGALLVYPSTDYVFSGNSDRPYLPSDPIAPVNAYGRSKAAGENAAREAERSLVIRTSWLYGAGGPNFVDTILRLARERDVLTVVDDQWGRPTWTGTLAECISSAAENGLTGVLHCSDGGGTTTWHGFATEAVRAVGLPTRIDPVPTEAYPRPAPRPRYSVLDCVETERLLGQILPDWRGSLRRHIERPEISARTDGARSPSG